MRIVEARPADIETLRAIDDDASALFGQHGVRIDMAPEHPFAQAEVARWLRSTELQRAFAAVDDAQTLVGFAALDLLGGEPYLDQLAVRVSAMRRGIGVQLLARAAEWARVAGGSALWLTTYARLPFNRPFYERHGFVVVPEADCPLEIAHHLDEQRHHLPAPEQRVAMRLVQLTAT